MAKKWVNHYPLWVVQKKNFHKAMGGRVSFEKVECLESEVKGLNAVDSSPFQPCLDLWDRIGRITVNNFLVILDNP